MSQRTDGRGPSRRAVLTAVATGGATAIAGCTGEDGDGNEGDGDDHGGEGEGRGTWVETQSTDVSSYNVFRIVDQTSADRVARVKDPLYELDDDDNLSARLVRDYEVNDDFTEYAFTLTEHAAWSDPYGRFTAEDVVYSINEVILGEDNWAAASNVGDWRTTPAGETESVDVEVEATGEFTFAVRFPEPNPGFVLEPVLWAFQAFMPKGLLEPYVEDRDGDGLDEDDAVQSLSYAGNLGAYTVDTIEPEARMLTVRNGDYYRRSHEGAADLPYFDAFEFRVIREESTRLSALQTGEVTTTHVPARRRDEFAAMDGVQVVDVPSAYVSSIIYQHRGNGAWDGWDDPAVRRAFTRATDVGSIVDDVLHGAARPAATYQPEWSSFYDDSEVDRIGFDPDRARAELADALPDGYAYDGDVLVEEATGEQLSLTYVYSTGVDDVEVTARFLAEEYGTHLGVDVDLEGVPFDVLLSEFLQVPNVADAREFDMIAGIRTNTYPRSPEATRQFWDPEFNAVLGGYPDPRGVTELLAEASRATDLDRRQGLLAEAFGVLSEEQPFNFLHFPDDVLGYRDDVEFGEESSPWWGYDRDRWRFRPE